MGLIFDAAPNSVDAVIVGLEPVTFPPEDEFVPRASGPGSWYGAGA